MRYGKVGIIIGIVVIAFGILFHLQGKAIVGPQSSFMYSNPDWIDYGFFIILLGLAIIGIMTWLIKTKKF